MSKKPTSNRLDKLFDDINDEAATPEKKAGKKATGDRKTVTRPPKSTKPVVRASTLAQTTPIPPPAEAPTLTTTGSETTPATLATGFQLDQRTWATLQVIDETAVRVWDENEEAMVRQVADQLSQALENARLFQETRSRAEELAILNEMGRELTTQFEMEKIASTIYQYTSRLMDTTNLFVSLYDENKQEIYPFFVINNNQRVPSSKRKLGKGLSDYILRTRQPLFIPEDMLGSMKKLGIEVMFLANTKDLAQCWLGAPLMVGDIPIGVIGLQSVDTPNLYTERHRDLLIAIAGRAAVAIENARLFQESNRRAQEMTTLAEVGREISATLDLETILEKIASRALNLLNAVTSAVYMPSEDLKTLKTVVALGEEAEDIRKTEVPIGVGIVGTIAQTGQGEIINNASDNPRTITIEGTEDVPDERLMAVPITTRSAVSGVMALWRVGPGTEFEPSELSFLASLAQQASIAVENARLFREAQDRAAELAVLNELAQRLSAQLDVNQVLQEIYRGVSRLIDTSNFYIGLYNPERNEVSFPLNVSESVIDKSIVTIKADQGLTGHIIQTRAPLLIPENISAKLTELGIATVGEPSKSWLGVPLTLGEQVIGVMAVQTYTKANAYTEHDRDILVTFAVQAAISIQNARLFEESRLRATELNALAELSRLVSQNLDIEQVFETAYRMISQIMPTDAFFINLYNESANKFVSSFDMDDNVRQSVEAFPSNEGFSGHILRTGESYIAYDLAANPPPFPRVQTDHSYKAIASLVAAPLKFSDNIIGVVSAQSYQPNKYTENDRRLLQAFADPIAIGIQNARLFQDVQRRADIERLTGEISTSFVSVSPAETDKGVDKALEALGEFLHTDRAYIFLFRGDGQVMDNTHEWCSPGTSSHIEGLQNIPSSTFPYLMKSIKRLGAFRSSHIADLPDDASAEKEEFLREGIKSIVCIPMILRGELIGFIGLDAVKDEHVWEDDELNLLRLVGDIIVTALNRKNTAVALEKSEADLRALFASMEDIVLVVDRDTRYVRIAPTNPSRLFRPSEELLGKRMDEILPPKTHEPFREAIHKVLDTGESAQIEYTLPVEDQEFWFLANLSKLNEDQVFWIARDITARKKAEEEIRRFKLGIDQSSDAVFITDTDGTITYINPGFQKIYGFSPEEAMGKTPRIIKSGLLTLENYQGFWGALLSKQTISGEIINKAKDGHFVSIAGTNSPILDERGNILGFLAVHHDITDRKRSEEALKRRNEYLAATAEIGRLVTSTLDMPTLFSRTVNLVRDKFGFYHAGLFITEETGFNAILQAATGEAGAEMLRQAHKLAVGSKSVVGQVADTGRPVIVNDTQAGEVHRFNPLLPDTRAEAAIPLRIGSRTIGALDIQSTQVNAFSDDDIAVLQSLADQIAISIDNARSYELSMQAVKEMREADRLKSQFLANMSHELRTPLNSIIGFSRVILKGIDGPITDLQQQDLLAIHNSGQHLLGLINDILDLSRIEAGKMELTFDEVHLPELITSVMSTVTGLVRDKPIQLVRDIPAELPTVRADSMRVRQVLINLFSNAAKFTDEGTITVTAQVMDKPGGHQEIMVRVTDTGPGISPEDQKKLFQPFSQVDASPTRKTGGSGLGLSISNHLIQMHGGRMGVESDTGQGSTFYFTLPGFRMKAPLTSESGAPGNHTILVIDDDPQVIALYERYLQPQGYQVVSVSDSARAVERAKQLKPFAITLDIMMPGVDGWHVLNDLKASSETRDIPVVVCSIVEDKEKGFSLGAADYLLKPILEDDLLNALDRLNPDGSIREVLIIDDKPDDLRLISKILTDHGRYHPTVAEGGANGWDAIQARAPHAVILDLFMPEMDGFAILEKMRVDDKLRDMPVIVVSAYDLTPEQQTQLQEFGQRMIQKSALTEQQLLDTLDQVLKRVGK